MFEDEECVACGKDAVTDSIDGPLCQYCAEHQFMPMTKEEMDYFFVVPWEIQVLTMITVLGLVLAIWFG